MILTVTLNTAVDKTYTVSGFSLDRVHRPEERRVVPGGKGVNVARVLNEMGVDTLAMGLAGGHNGAYIKEGLEREQIPHLMVETREESRVCTTIIDPERKTQTEVNENGPVIQEHEFRELDEALREHLPRAEALVLCGSIPPGVPPDAYARWISAAREAGVWVLLDSSGRALAEGIKAQPNCAKPNRREFMELTSSEVFTAEEIVENARPYVEDGVELMLVSLGKAGAVALTRDESWASTPPEIDFVSAVGSGDAFVAGFLYARHHGHGLAEAMRMSTAAGAANAMTFGAGFCSKECIQSLAAQVEVRKLTEETVTR